MGNISRHTGINIGGLNSISWIFREDVGIFSFYVSSLNCLITPKLGKSWNAIYGTPETIQLESEQQDTPAGMKYIYKLKILVPKDRAPVESELYAMVGRRLILKSGDKNGTIRVFGTMDCPMKVTSKLIKPAAMEGFNGYELLFTGEFNHPAAYYLDPLGPIPDDEIQD
jgi:hypothetical protein